MKIYLAMISAAALALAACSQEAAKPTEPVPAPASEAAVSAPEQAASEAAPSAEGQAQQPAASAETPAPQAAVEEKPTEEAKPEPEAKPAESAAADGKKVFDGLCFGCHGANSAIPDTPRITHKDEWAPRIKKGKDTLFKHALEGFTDKGMMPARGGNSALSDDEVKAAVVYMVNESGGKF